MSQQQQSQSQNNTENSLQLNLVNTFFQSPLERVLKQQQTHNIQKQVSHGNGQQYQGIANSLQQISKEQGINSLWRASPLYLVKLYASPTIHSQIQKVANIIKPVYDQKEQRGKYILTNIFNGISVGTLTVLLTYPLEILTVKTETDTKCVGFSKYIKQIYEKEGIKGFYAGFAASVFGVIAYRFAFMGLKGPFSKILNSKELSLKKTVANTILLIIANLAMLPFTLVKNRQILQSGQNHVYNGGIIDNFKKICEEEGGVKGLFNGASVIICKVIVQTVITTLFEQITQQKDTKQSKQ